MLRRNKTRKQKLKVNGLIIVIIGFTICSCDMGYKYYVKITDNKKIEQFITNNIISKNIEETEEELKIDEYIGILEIEKINLKKGFYTKNSSNNKVSKGLEIINKSDMPNIKYGTFIIASHSGNGQVAYFNKLYKLTYGDIINVYYNENKYKYELIDIYEVDKNRIVEIDKESDKTILVLITCNKNDDKKQVVYISKLIEIF